MSLLIFFVVFIIIMSFTDGYFKIENKWGYYDWSAGRFCYLCSKLFLDYFCPKWLSFLIFKRRFKSIKTCSKGSKKTYLNWLKSDNQKRYFTQKQVDELVRIVENITERETKVYTK